MRTLRGILCLRGSKQRNGHIHRVCGRRGVENPQDVESQLQLVDARGTLCATLRGTRQYEFLDRLVSVALPRIRDFRGVSPNSFDGRGNYTLGLREQLAFPEIDYDRIDKVRGLEVSIVTTAQNDEEGRSLLTKLGVPFSRPEQAR